MAELEAILQKAIKALDILSVPYVIVGGLAAILHGSPRTTSDIDIIIQNTPDIADKIINIFRSENFEIMEFQIRSAIKAHNNASIYIKDSVIRIDLKIAKQPDEIEVLEQAKTELFKGITIRIASVEQILYGKVLYLGDISDLSNDELLDFNDTRDFINVMLTESTIDLVWLTNKVKQKGLYKTLFRLMKIVEKKRKMK